MVNFYNLSSANIKLCDFQIIHRNLGLLQGNVKQSSLDSCTNFIAEIKDSSGKILGTDSIGIFPNENIIIDFYIKTKPNYRNIYKIGELLRLTSIIEMLENKLEAMKLHSLDTSILFHQKYGFKADINKFKERDAILSTISKDLRFPELVKKAHIILEQVIEADTYDKINQLNRLTSELADLYLIEIKKTNSNPNPNSIFSHGIDMILTKDNIMNNRKEFNQMFNKHNIDYNI